MNYLKKYIILALLILNFSNLGYAFPCLNDSALIPVDTTVG